MGAFGHPPVWCGDTEDLTQETTQLTDIRGLVEPYLADEHLELDDLELSGHGRGRVLRVIVDGDGVDLGRLSELSRGLARLLDDAPSLQDPYQLEVSSPGLERKLRRPSHFQKSVGREVVVKVRTDHTRTVRGRLTDAGDSTFTVESDDEAVSIGYDDVITAKTVFRWEKAPKPGHKETR